MLSFIRAFSPVFCRPFELFLTLFETGQFIQLQLSELHFVRKLRVFLVDIVLYYVNERNTEL